MYHPHGIDPMTLADEQIELDRQEDAQREQDFAAFVALVRDFSQHGWGRVVDDISDALVSPSWPHPGFRRDVQKFAAEYQWSGVFSALCTARRQWEDEMAKTMEIR